MSSTSTPRPTTPAASAPASSGPPYLSPQVLADRQVTFRIQAPKADEVTLNADWLPIDKPKLAKGDKGILNATVGPLPPGVYIYSFNIDGVAMPDALNPDVKLRARTTGSMVTVPGSEPGFSEYRDVPHGTVEINWHRSSALDATRAVHVYLPPGYGATNWPIPTW